MLGVREAAKARRIPRQLQSLAIKRREHVVATDRSEPFRKWLVTPKELAWQRLPAALRELCQKPCQTTDLLTVLPKTSRGHPQTVTGVVVAVADRELRRFNHAAGGAAAVTNRSSHRHEPVAAGRSGKSKQR